MRSFNINTKNSVTFYFILTQTQIPIQCGEISEEAEIYHVLQFMML